MALWLEFLTFHKCCLSLTEGLLCAGAGLVHYISNVLFNLHKNILKYYYHPQFTEKETKAE